MWAKWCEQNKMQLLFIILEQQSLSFSITGTKTRQATIAGLVLFKYAGFTRVIFQSLDFPVKWRTRKRLMLNTAVYAEQGKTKTGCILYFSFSKAALYYIMNQINLKLINSIKKKKKMSPIIIKTKTLDIFIAVFYQHFM